MVTNPSHHGTWHKSSYSAGNGGECVEVATGLPDVVPVRDSKDPAGPALAFDTAAWAAFVAGIKAGGFSA
ncbi:DUF397 domain-containing protein [Streptomyces buecherae]|uniref:DUF397 domain-containing protein n=1 Tax=Streptomyces buecherae TaxID=2763006 RepID=UPI001C27761A|nr:DUF397 domain-containing protein [Streptomyces buecherae]